MSNEKFPRSERTIHPCNYTPPLRGKRFKEAKDAEVMRQQFDPGYVSRDQAAAIPQEVVIANPDLRFRIEHSRPDWPESRAVASIALGPLKTGEGQVVTSRPIRVEDVTGGGRIEEP